MKKGYNNQTEIICLPDTVLTGVGSCPFLSYKSLHVKRIDPRSAHNVCRDTPPAVKCLERWIPAELRALNPSSRSR